MKRAQGNAPASCRCTWATTTSMAIATSLPRRR